MKESYDISVLFKILKKWSKFFFKKKNDGKWGKIGENS